MIWFQFYAIIGNCRFGNGHLFHSLMGPERIWYPYPGAPPIIWLLVVLIPNQRKFDPFYAGWQRIINGPPSKPHLVAFYDMQGEGHLLLLRSSTVPFYIHVGLRPKDGCTFAPFRWHYCGRRHLLTNRNILRYNILAWIYNLYIHDTSVFVWTTRTCSHRKFLLISQDIVSPLIPCQWKVFLRHLRCCCRRYFRKITYSRGRYSRRNLAILWWKSGLMSGMFRMNNHSVIGVRALLRLERPCQGRVTQIDDGPYVAIKHCVKCCCSSKWYDYTITCNSDTLTIPRG